MCLKNNHKTRTVNKLKFVYYLSLISKVGHMVQDLLERLRAHGYGRLVGLSPEKDSALGVWGAMYRSPAEIDNGVA